MFKKSLFFVAAFLIYGNSLAQVPDATVILHEDMLNGFLNAVGPVSGKKQFNILGTKGDYTWTLANARIEIDRDRASFIADARVKAGLFSYSAPAAGDVEVKYDSKTNRIKIKVLKAVFEVYTKIFGKKIHITDVDAATFYRPEFEFAGPQPVQPSVSITLPDGSIKTIYIIPVSQDLKLVKSEIVVTSHLIFSDQPAQTIR